jgi:hypothetical protein
MKRALLLGVLWAARAAAASEPSVVEAIDARRDHWVTRSRRAAPSCKKSWRGRASP